MLEEVERAVDLDKVTGNVKTMAGRGGLGLVNTAKKTEKEKSSWIVVHIISSCQHEV